MHGISFYKLIEFDTRTSNKDLFDLVFKAFSNLKYLKKFRFQYKKFEDIYIKKQGNYFILDYNFEKESLDYNQLVKKCNLIRSK